MRISGQERQRYDCQLVLKEVGERGQDALRAGSVLVVGAGEQAEPMGATAAPAAAVTLAKPITNGLTYNFTFTFDKSGTATVAVPISAGEPAP